MRHVWNVTKSSILRMLRTVSVARLSALSDTSRGCTTSSSRMLEIPPCRTKSGLVYGSTLSGSHVLYRREDNYCCYDNQFVLSVD